MTDINRPKNLGKLLEIALKIAKIQNCTQRILLCYCKGLKSNFICEYPKIAVELEINAKKCIKNS